MMAILGSLALLAIFAAMAVICAGVLLWWIKTVFHFFGLVK